jgi:hypothetical protein
MRESDYDRWLTTDYLGEQQMAEAEDIMNNGMRYYETDRTWWRDVEGRVRWSCEFCGGIWHCYSTCWTVEPADLDLVAAQMHSYGANDLLAFDRPDDR